MKKIKHKNINILIKWPNDEVCKKPILKRKGLNWQSYTYTSDKFGSLDRPLITVTAVSPRTVRTLGLLMLPSSHQTKSVTVQPLLLQLCQLLLWHTPSRGFSCHYRNQSSFRLLTCYTCDEHLTAKDTPVRPQLVYKVIDVPWLNNWHSHPSLEWLCQF